MRKGEREVTDYNVEVISCLLITICIFLFLFHLFNNNIHSLVHLYIISPPLPPNATHARFLNKFQFEIKER